MPQHLRQKYSKIAIIDTDMHQRSRHTRKFFMIVKDVTVYLCLHVSRLIFIQWLQVHEHEKGQAKAYGVKLIIRCLIGTDEKGSLVMWISDR